LTAGFTSCRHCLDCLLYYFNFVQAVALPKAKADNTAAGITKHIAPQALLWFRWAALVTWLTGAWYLERSGIGLGAAFMLKGSAAAIGLGAWLAPSCCSTCGC